MVPRHRVASNEDVVAPQRGDGDACDAIESDLAREGPVLRLDLAEPLLGVLDEVHLVDRERHVTHAEEGHELTVAAGLRQHPLAGVDEDHRRIRGRGAGDHVPRVLLVARRVGDDEVPALGREMAVRDVDGDPLLALGR